MPADTHAKRGAALSPDDRLRAYELLYLMNAAFHDALTCILQVWDEFKPHLSGARMEQLEQFSKECQSVANGYFLETFEPLENFDRDLFGRVRKAREDYWEQMSKKPDTPKKPEK